jgi:hypothetical protein
MAAKPSNGNVKRKSKGIRKHVRRMKQETRKAGTPLSEWKKKVRVEPISKKKAA